MAKAKSLTKPKEDDVNSLKGAKALRTERTAREVSPLIPNEDGDSQTKTIKAITLEEEISKKLNEPKINQEFINNWEWGKENPIGNEGTAQNGYQVQRMDTPSKQMKI